MHPDDAELLGILVEAADAAAVAFGADADRGLVAGSAVQHASDLRTDAAVRAVLRAAGLRILSEESGGPEPGAGPVVVVDPLDGSTNAAHGIGWWATSLCVVDDVGPRVALVRNLVSGEVFTAVRGAGAFLDGAPLVPRRRAAALTDALVLVSGLPRVHPGWRQFRAFGAVALDLCAVAAGRADAYLDCSVDAHGPWDHGAAVLVCAEAGVTVVDALGRDLVPCDHAARRTPVAGEAAVVADLVARWPALAGVDA